MPHPRASRWPTRITHVIAGALCACLLVTPAASAEVRVGRTIATGLQAPWGLAFLPDGSALVGERDSGRVLRITRTGARPIEVGRLSVESGSEGGLLGLAVAPGPHPGALFAYISTGRDNRILRIPWDGRRLGRPAPILTGIPHGSRHNGGRLAFGPDGMLYASTGDAGRPELAQRRGSLAGKVLRMTTGGRPAPGNPWRTVVWSLGHRNVQGLAFDSSGRLLATELGEQATDELNRIVPGGNYGWPVHEGRAGDPRYEDPIASWSPTSSASPSGLAVDGGTAYVAMLAGRALWTVPLGTPSSRARTGIDLGRLRTVTRAPDGSLWLVTSNTDGRTDPRRGDDRVVRLLP